MRKTHFINPVTKTQTCGMGGDSLHLQLTDDINQVTCQHCLNTASGKKRAGGVKPWGKEAKVKVTLSIDRELRKKATIKKLNCSQLLEEAIRKVK